MLTLEELEKFLLVLYTAQTSGAATPIQFLNAYELEATDVKDCVIVRLACGITSTDPTEAFFPLEHREETKELRSAIQKKLQPLTNSDGQVLYYTIPLAVVRLAYLASTWQTIHDKAKEIDLSTNRTMVFEIARKYNIDNENAYLLVWQAKKDQFTNFYECIATLVQKVTGRLYKVSLVRLIRKNPDAAKELLKKCFPNDSLDAFVTREQYLLGAKKWENSETELPDYWLTPGLAKHRADTVVLRNLARTPTIKSVLNHVAKNTVLLLTGESGSGKTCALLAAGKRAYDVHIVITLDDLADENIMKSVDENIVATLRYALFHTQGNANISTPLKVMLHVDEAGHPEKLAQLIRVSPELRNVHLYKEGSIQLSMRVGLAVAGTGLEAVFSAATGSVASLIHLVTVQPPPDPDLRLIVQNYLTGGAVKAVLRRKEVMRLVATNMRLLSFTLTALDQALQRVWEDRKENLIHKDVKRHEKQCKDKGLVSIKMPGIASDVRSVLPATHACLGE